MTTVKFTVKIKTVKITGKEMNYKIVAERMRKIRKEKGITIAHIEEITGFRNCIVRRLLWGRRAPRLSEFALLCIALEASADELLRTDEKWEIIER